MEKGRKKKNKLKDVQLHISVNSQDKEAASLILEECGTTLNSVIEMLLKHIINHKGVPFSIELPREENDFLNEEGLKEENLAVKEETTFIEDSIDMMLEEEMDSDVNFDNLFQDETEHQHEVVEEIEEIEESEPTTDMEETMEEEQKLEELRAFLLKI